jgi:opacity protein-like surface antigen
MLRFFESSQIWLATPSSRSTGQSQRLLPLVPGSDNLTKVGPATVREERFMWSPVKAVPLSVCITAAIIGLSCQYVSAGVIAAPLLGTGSNSANASSWLGGVQLGYNHQQGSFVFGFETDISATHLKTDMSTVIPDFGILPVTTANTNSKVDWYGTSRGVLGWANGPVMFFGTGGVAYGRVHLNSSISNTLLSLISETSAVKVGWVGGGGILYMLNPNLFLSLAYQHVDLGSVSLTSSIGETGPGSASLSQNASANARFDVVSLGLNWRFYPTNGSPQAPWQGAYVGGHAGGAWGLNTNANYSTTGSGGGCCPCDVRLKRDITLVGRLEDGLGIYRYRYLWSDTVYVGVMAQEVALDHPDAVVRGPFGYLSIDYSKLGLKLMTLSEWEARGKVVNLPANRVGQCLLSGAERT